MEQISSRILIVRSSTSAKDTLMSPATTSPLSSTRSRTSTSPVDRCPSVSDVGIGSVFYGTSPARRTGDYWLELAYLSNADATAPFIEEPRAGSYEGVAKPDSGLRHNVALHYSVSSSSGVSINRSEGRSWSIGKD